MRFFVRLSVGLLLVASAGVAWSQRSSHDPAAKNQSSRPEAFIDFVLKQINPQNTDYGCEIEKARKLAVDETVRSIDFWVTLIALSFLVMSFFMLLIQKRQHDRHEVIASRFLAQYHNAWVDARTRAEQAIRRHNELADATARSAETIPMRQPSVTETAQTAALNGEPKMAVRQKLATGIVAKNTVQRSVAGDGDNKSSSHPHDQSPADFMTQIKALQNQLTAAHERENNLKRELSKVQRHGQAEPIRST